MIKRNAAGERPSENADTHSHTSPVTDRLRQGRLFLSDDENNSGLVALARFDVLLSEAETEGLYPRWMDGSIDDHDYAGQSVSAEVEGRSAEKWIEDFHNGPDLYDHEIRTFAAPTNDHKAHMAGYTPMPAIVETYKPISQAGRFRFNDRGIICGYRLNKGDLDTGDIWVGTQSPSYPPNVVTPRDKRPAKGRHAPGKTLLTASTGTANDNFEARSQLEWLKARMSPEHYDAAYDATAGHGFGEIGRAAGFTGKPAEAVGKDRVRGGIRSLVRLFAEIDG